MTGNGVAHMEGYSVQRKWHPGTKEGMPSMDCAKVFGFVQKVDCGYEQPLPVSEGARASQWHHQGHSKVL